MIASPNHPADRPSSELGYPAVKPASINLSPISNAPGAKPSVVVHATGNNVVMRGKSHFATSKSATSQAAAHRNGPPLPKRAKGRLFIGMVFVAALTTGGLSIYNSLLRYTAYGEVTGRKLQIAVPWPGVIQSIHVREGDSVAAGDVIARIDSLEMRQKMEELDDQLRLQRASLSSELAMLRWEAEKIRDIRKLSQSEFYEKWSDLLWEQSRLADLTMQLDRIRPMQRQGIATVERLESLQFQVAGQQKRVEHLTVAVSALKHRSDDSPTKLDLEDRVQPTLIRIENLQAELKRTREILQQGAIRAPADGRIIRTHRFVGEYADSTTSIAELFVDGSSELVLYVPQHQVQEFPIGRVVTLHVDPINQKVKCEVRRVAMEMRTAPDALANHYRDHQSLLPIFLSPCDSDGLPSWITLGSEVRLPRSHEIDPIARLASWWNSGPQQSVCSIALPSESSGSSLSVRRISQQVKRIRYSDKTIVAKGQPSSTDLVHSETTTVATNHATEPAACAALTVTSTRSRTGSP
ncbi:MAG: biotin/lipoyl-binding protein [Pirellulaceae bacterium]|nr:biotin/lipoyl-binding protein [Pirellulaceae bacterium]